MCCTHLPEDLGRPKEANWDSTIVLHDDLVKMDEMLHTHVNTFTT